MRLLVSILAGLNKTKPAQRRFLGHLLELLLMLPGRATFRNLGRYSDYHEKTFSRWFAQEFDWVAMNRAAIREVVPADHEQVLALDPSFIPKRGKRTYGLDRFWNSTHSQVEKGLEINSIVWVDVTANRGLSSNRTENRVKTVLGYHRSLRALIDRLSKSE